MLVGLEHQEPKQKMKKKRKEKMMIMKLLMTVIDWHNMIDFIIVKYY